MTLFEIMFLRGYRIQVWTVCKRDAINLANAVTSALSRDHDLSKPHASWEALEKHCDFVQVSGKGSHSSDPLNEDKSKNSSIVVLSTGSSNLE